MEVLRDHLGNCYHTIQVNQVHFTICCYSFFVQLTDIYHIPIVLRQTWTTSLLGQIELNETTVYQCRCLYQEGGRIKAPFSATTVIHH